MAKVIRPQPENTAVHLRLIHRLHPAGAFRQGDVDMQKSFWKSVCYGLAIVASGLAAGQSSNVSAQQENAHFENWADLPPGEVGRRQLERGGLLRGYFQPVQIIAPEGAHVSVLVEGRFHSYQASSAMAGMLIGDVYKIRITRIPNRAGFEVYPSIELIDRVYPPQGLEERFPIPVVVTQDDLDRAIAGEFGVRVVYLEDPSLALPVPQRSGEQRSIDVDAGDDPLVAAEKLGRPMAIVRIGSRVPDEALAGGPTWSPAIQILESRDDAEERAQLENDR